MTDTFSAFSAVFLFGRAFVCFCAHLVVHYLAIYSVFRKFSYWSQLGCKEYMYHLDCIKKLRTMVSGNVVLAAFVFSFCNYI